MMEACLLKKNKEVLLLFPTFPLILKLLPSKFSGHSISCLLACKPHNSPILTNHLSKIHIKKEMLIEITPEFQLKAKYRRKNQKAMLGTLHAKDRH